MKILAVKGLNILYFRYRRKMIVCVSQVYPLVENPGKSCTKANHGSQAMTAQNIRIFKNVNIKLTLSVILTTEGLTEGSN